MDILTQNLKDGKMEFLEAPFPALNRGMVLVRNYFSVISAGTEGKTVNDARLGYIAKAKARQEDVKKVITAAKNHGVIKTYQMVMNKLEAPSPLGYSCSGQVIAVADDVNEFKVGDWVACGGTTANHSEVVAVPKNLCVKVSEPSKIKEAAFATIGAIAMQGVRQANVSIAEHVVVIGLGLVGQLTCQILQAAGINVIGVDINQNAVSRLSTAGMLAFNRNKENLDQLILDYTNKQGADAVIITASSSSNDPVEFSGIIARRKARIVIVGAVPTGFSRKNYYRKELELVMSCSYGPGRYDPNYEELGVDYPYEYVRWTEQRNMQSFVQLIEQEKINLANVITHQYPFNDAPKAYQMILDKEEDFCGIVLEYDVNKALENNAIIINKGVKKENIICAFIGAGSFAQNFLLPNIQGITFKTVVTSKPQSSINIAQKYGFEKAATSIEEVLNDKEINTVFIATPHNLHFQQVKACLEHQKNVFVEKPLCLKLSELEELKKVYLNANVNLILGFNRRFAPFIKTIKAQLTNQPLAINYRINAGILPPNHWVHHPEIGGGRILGEVCHFIDLVTFISHSKIKSIHSSILSDSSSLNDTLTISIKLENGSVASIAYFSNGNNNISKEHLEVFQSGNVFVIDDFKTLSISSNNKKKVIKSTQDKGHKNELFEFVNALKNGEQMPISFDEIYHSMQNTFKVIENCS